jgi:hypothetical protein
MTSSKAGERNDAAFTSRPPVSPLRRERSARNSQVVVNTGERIG